MEETKKALKEMGSWKAPGPNRYQPGFIKNTWDIIGHDVHQFVQGVIKGKEVSNEAASALLVLVPKETKLSMLKNFRPVSLCNVSVKLVTMVLANRLKMFLKDLVSSNQSSFIPRRQSLDNVVICQEIVHTLKHTIKKRGMVLKIDLEKTYDMMEWDFVEETLRDAYLPTKISDAIMNLICKSSCRLLWNGEETKVIKSSRGFR